MKTLKTYSSCILLLFFLISYSSLAQIDLHVSSNANTYIFVDGDGFADQSAGATNAALFVTDGINLAGANSFIYLRDGAQLLQSNESAFNSGLGQLSVYQWGTVDEYQYNYWGSPVGNTTANNTANRNFIPNNNIYDLVAAPITSNIAGFTTGYEGTSAPLVISERWIWSFSPGEVYADWDFVGDGSGANGGSGIVTPGYGFTMKGTDAAGPSQLYDFRGKPNTGQMNVNVLAPVAGNPQWTLAGNPYASAIDMVDFFHDATANNGAVMSQILFWEHNSTGSHFLEDYVGYFR